MRTLLAWVSEHLKLQCCKETLRKQLHRMGFAYKKARKFLKRAESAERSTYMMVLRQMLDEARRGRRTLVFIDEAHIHQGLDPGLGWGKRGEPRRV